MRQVCQADFELLPNWALRNSLAPPKFYTVFLFVCLFFGYVLWLAGSQFPSQGRNPGHSSESAESQPLDQQRTPYAVFF